MHYSSNTARPAAVHILAGKPGCQPRGAQIVATKWGLAGGRGREWRWNVAKQQQLVSVIVGIAQVVAVQAKA